jgi:cytochrome c oxidase subunit II
MKTPRALWGAIFGVVCAAAMAQSADIQRGQQIYVICGACHGERALGESRLSAPSLVGQSEAYLLRQLRDFRSGIRGGKGDDPARQMQQILETVSNEADWKAVIAYVRSLPVDRPQASLPGDIERGRQIYETCLACHGPDAAGNAALDVPNLRVLPDWYIMGELKKFASGARGAAPADLAGSRMRAIAATLRSDADIRAVASFIVRR